MARQVSEVSPVKSAERTVRILEALAASPHEVPLVVARPPKGRDAQASPLQRAERLSSSVKRRGTTSSPATR